MGIAYSNPGKVNLSLDTKERFVEQVLAVDEQIDNLKTQMSLLKGKLSKLENAKRLMEEQAVKYMTSTVQPVKSKYILETTTHLLTVSVPHTSRVIIEDELLIPKEYIRIKEEKSINKEKLKVDLKDGLEIPGVRLEPSDPKFSVIDKKDDSDE